MSMVDLPPNIHYYLANQTLEISEGTFYSKWSFSWCGDFVLATVANFGNQITLISGHTEEDAISIIEWIKNKKEELNEVQEGGN